MIIAPSLRLSFRLFPAAAWLLLPALASATPQARLLGHHETARQPTTVTILDGGEGLAVASRGDESVWIFDTSSMEPVAKYSLIGHHGVWGVASLGSGALLVSNWTGETLSRVDRASGVVTATISTGIKPSYVALSADGTRAFAAGHLTGDVALIDVAKGRLDRLVEVGQKPMGVAASPDGRWLYVAVCRSRKIAKVDLKHEVVLTNFGTPLAETTNLAITPDGTHVLAAGTNDRLLVVDTESGRTLKIKVGRDPAAVAISPDGRTAFVAHYAGASVGIVDLAEGVMVGEVQVGPGCIDVATDGKRLYSCSDQASSVSVFELREAEPADIPPAAGG